jgi:Uma2 family endonuclease
MGKSSTCRRSEPCTPRSSICSPDTLLAARESVFIRCQNPLRLDDVSEPEPDISILRPRADFYTTGHPGPADVLLVVEVADTSLAYDLGVKVPLYMSVEKVLRDFFQE